MDWICYVPAAVVVTLSAFSLYLGNVTIGVLARFFGRRFGILHHVAYATVFAAATVALLTEYHPALWITLGALAAFPRARPRSAWHPTLAAIGALGYLLALATHL